MANTWILIRHPHKEGDDQGIYLGDTAKITNRGQEQMQWVTARLKMIQPEAITCSMFPRAIALAEYIAEELGFERDSIVKHKLFNEIDKPQFLIGEHRTSREHETVMQAIRDQFDDDTVPAELLRGESIKTRSEIEKDIATAFRYIEDFWVNPMKSPVKPSMVLTVSHAKRIAAYGHWIYRNDGSLKGYYSMADRALTVSTTGITIFVRQPNRRTGEVEWHIKTWNEETHFDEELNALLRRVT